MENNLKFPTIFLYNLGKEFILSLERVFQTMKRLNFSKFEAEVYVHLAKAGPKSGKDIAEYLDLTQQQLHTVIKNLQNKGAIKISRRKTTLFSASSFEEILNSFIETNIHQAQFIQRTKQGLLSSWQEIIDKDDH